MSCGLLSHYLQGSNDLSTYFPPYEIQYSYQVPTNGWGGSDRTIILTRNQYLSTNYIVLFSYYYDSTNDGEIQNLSIHLRPPLVLTKRTDSFDFRVQNNAGITISSNIFFWCLVIYIDSNNFATANISTSSLSFNNIDTTASNQIAYNIPQYVTNTASSTDAENFGVAYDISAKGWSGGYASTSYFSFSGYEFVSCSGSSAAVKTIPEYLGNVMNLTDGDTNYRNNGLFSLFARSNDFDGSFTVYIRTLTLFPPTIYNTPYNYSTNFSSKVNNTSYNLASIFPRSWYYNYGIDNNNGTINGTVSFGFTADNADYYIFTSLYYNDRTGSSGTYDIYEASQGAHSVVCHGKTTSYFYFKFTKTTGDNWNGGITFLVIFP